MSDFERLNRRLAELRSERTDTSVTDTEAELRARSKRLATRQLSPPEAEVFAEVVTVRRRNMLLGFPVASAREVRRVTMTGFPESTATVNGVFQIRGRVLSLVDLAPFGGESTALAHGDETLVIVIGDDDRNLGVRIDEVIGQQTIETGDIDDEFRGASLPFVSNVTRDLVHVIDVTSLRETPEIQIRGVEPDAGGV